MGTLYDQMIRPTFEITIGGDSRWEPTEYSDISTNLSRGSRTVESLSDTLDEMLAVAKKKKVEVSDVIALYAAMVQYRASKVMEDHTSDRWDEQIAGIGKEISRVSEALESIAIAVGWRFED